MAVFAADFPSDPDVDPGVGGQWTHPETGVVYEWDGVAWNIAGGAGSEGGSGGGGNNGGGGGGGDTPPGGGGGGDPIDLSGDVEIGTDCDNGSLTVHSPAQFDCGVVVQKDVLIEGQLNVLGQINIDPIISNDINVEGDVVLGTDCGNSLEVKGEATFDCKVQANSSVNVDGDLTYRGQEVAIESALIDEAQRRLEGDEALNKRIDNLDGYDDQAIFDGLTQETLERKEADKVLNAKSIGLASDIEYLKKNLASAAGELSDKLDSLEGEGGFVTFPDLVKEQEVRAKNDALLDERVTQNKENLDTEVTERIASQKQYLEFAETHFEEINNRINDLVGNIDGDVVAYDDTFIKQKLEEEKYYRVDEDNKLSERIDVLEAMSGASIIVSEEDPLEADADSVVAGTIWHRYNPDEPELGATFIAVPGESDALIWISLAGAKNLDQLSDVQLDLLTSSNLLARKAKAIRLGDLPEGHFEPNEEWTGEWSYHKTEAHVDLDSIGGWFAATNPGPAGEVGETTNYQELVLTRNSDASDLSGQFDLLIDNPHAVVQVYHEKTFGNQWVVWPVANCVFHTAGSTGYGKRCYSLYQLEEDLFLDPDTDNHRDAVLVQFGTWVPTDGAPDPDPDPEPGEDPYIDCFLGYDAASKLWCAKLINCSGGSCIVAQEDPLLTHSKLEQGTIWHQIQSGSSPDALRENDIHNTFVLVDGEGDTQSWSQTTGSYLSTSGGKVEGRVVIDSGDEEGSAFTLYGNLKTEDGIKRGKLINVDDNAEKGDAVFYRGEITRDNAIVNKKYVDEMVQDIGGGRVRVPFNLAKEPPENAADGTMWFPADENSLKIRYDGSWVPAVTDPYSGAYLPKQGLAHKYGGLTIRPLEGEEGEAKQLFAIYGTYNYLNPDDQAKVFWYDRNVDENGNLVADAVGYRGRCEDRYDLANKGYVDVTLGDALDGIDTSFFNKDHNSVESPLDDDDIEMSGSTLEFVRKSGDSYDYNYARSWHHWRESRSPAFILGNANRADKTGTDFHGIANEDCNGDTKWQKAFRFQAHNIDNIQGNTDKNKDVVIACEIYDRLNFTEYYNVAVRPNWNDPSGLARPGSRSKDRTVTRAIRYYDDEGAGMVFQAFVVDPDDSDKWDTAFGDDTGSEAHRAANKGYVDRQKFHPGQQITADSDGETEVGGLFLDGDRVYIKLS